jgi:glutamate--cysteine ligase
MDDLRAHAFAPPPGTLSGVPRIGAEVEFLPVERETRHLAPIFGSSRHSSQALLRAIGAARGWAEHTSEKGVPVFLLPDGGRATFEPGGQIEYSSPPDRSASVVLERMRSFAAVLSEAADARDIDVLTVGIDPVNPADAAPLQLHAPRYARMAAFFATIGPAGARMMRQTASIQINLDPPGGDATAAWRLLNQMAPYLTAMFANSSRYGGRPTGHCSFRAQCWRSLDPGRTGLVGLTGDPIEAYLDFALSARALLVESEPGDFPVFADWAERAGVDESEWQVHLTTLFPEVRPRGHFEVRSIDALPPRWYAAPLALLAGLLYDTDSRHAAVEVTAGANPDLLWTGGREGLRDPAIGRPATALFELALGACRRLGPAVVNAADLAVAAEFFETYTRRGRSPADDVEEPVALGR